MAQSNGRSLVYRLACQVGEQRHERAFSLNELARYAAVSRSTIARLERDGSVNPALLIRVAATLNTIQLARPPRDDRPVLELARDLARWKVDGAGTATLLEPPRTVLAISPALALGGAA